MAEEEKDEYLKALMLPKTPVEKQERRAPALAALAALAARPRHSHGRRPHRRRARLSSQIRKMVAKARTNELYPMLKLKLRQAAPDLVPYTAQEVDAGRAARA